jgi:hypothetical protein
MRKASKKKPRPKSATPPSRQLRERERKRQGRIERIDRCWEAILKIARKIMKEQMDEEAMKRGKRRISKSLMKEQLLSAFRFYKERSTCLTRKDSIGWEEGWTTEIRSRIERYIGEVTLKTPYEMNKETNIAYAAVKDARKVVESNVALFDRMKRLMERLLDKFPQFHNLVKPHWSQICYENYRLYVECGLDEAVFYANPSALEPPPRKKLSPRAELWEDVSPFVNRILDVQYTGRLVCPNEALRVVEEFFRDRLSHPLVVYLTLTWYMGGKARTYGSKAVKALKAELDQLLDFFEEVHIRVVPLPDSECGLLDHVYENLETRREADIWNEFMKLYYC